MRIQNYRDPTTIEAEPTSNQPANASTLSKDQHQSRVSIGGEGAADSQKMETVSDTSSQRALKQIENFQLENIPPKVICLKP